MNDEKAPFDESTVVDAAELAEWLGTEVEEVKDLAAAGVLRAQGGLYPLKLSVQAYVSHFERQATGGRLM